mmetsp:Transcript_34792/g.68679  ORF Transcript_34792/g.68679 Transcript_34792/m.68679 type:complete len:282 (+) Transcript_34792:1828-2673(+)
MLLCCGLSGVLGVLVFLIEELPLTECRIVVEVDLCIDAVHVSSICQRKRVDLHLHGIGVAEEFVQLLHLRRHLVLLGLGGESECVGNLQAGGLVHSVHDVHGKQMNCVRVLLCHLLDVHSSLLGGNQHRTPILPVEDNGQVEFLHDVYTLMHQHLVHVLALRSCLMSDEFVPNHLLCESLHFIGRCTDLDSPLQTTRKSSFAAPSCENLGLENKIFCALSLQPLGNLPSFCCIGGDRTLLDIQAELSKQRLALVFVEVQEPSRLQSEKRRRSLSPDGEHLC